MPRSLKALLFDLDDTLYSERDFVASGYRAVARYATRRHCCNEARVFEYMMNVLANEGRRSVLPMLTRRFLDPSVPLAELVSVYRDHDPVIRPFPGYVGLLKRLRRRYALGLITDGLPAVQRRKVAALRLDGVFDRIIYTWEHGREKQKPHPHSFLLMAQELGVAPEDVTCIGDNESKDGEGAWGVGMQFVHACTVSSHKSRPVRTRGSTAGRHLESLHRLPELLVALN
jgi:putative hydrolase of the HAD superfamily